MRYEWWMEEESKRYKAKEKQKGECYCSSDRNIQSWRLSLCFITSFLLTCWYVSFGHSASSGSVWAGVSSEGTGVSPTDCLTLSKNPMVKVCPLSTVIFESLRKCGSGIVRLGYWEPTIEYQQPNVPFLWTRDHLYKVLEYYSTSK